MTDVDRLALITRAMDRANDAVDVAVEEMRDYPFSDPLSRFEDCVEVLDAVTNDKRHLAMILAAAVLRLADAEKGP